MKVMHKLFLCAVLLLAAYKLEDLSSVALKAKSLLRNQYHILRTHRHSTEISDIPPLTSQGDEWFSKYHFIAHNGGIIHGRLKSDSLEAWHMSYSRGIRIIDADLAFTSDNYLVLRHSWNDNLEQSYFPGRPALKDFKNSLIFMKFRPMTAEDMINFMLSHDDLYVAVDSKSPPEKVYPALVQAARNLNAEKVLARIIVSLYRTDDVHKVKSVYPFQHFVLRQYGWQHNWYKLAEFCIKNNIHVVNIFDFVIDNDPEGVKILTSKGIHVYAAIINSLRQLQAYKNLGITGAVSDYLSESDWELLK